jgi:hypothetical protein
MTIRKHRFTMAALFGLCLVALAGVAPQADAADAPAQAPPLDPGMARVWFLRPSANNFDIVGAADPIVYANGAPIGQIASNTDFFRDFTPGTYRFTVQPYGVPTGESATLQLTAGTQRYLEVQWAQRWELGYASSGAGTQDRAFAVFPMTPELAMAYLPDLTYRGVPAPSQSVAQLGQSAAGFAGSANATAWTDPPAANSSSPTAAPGTQCPAGFHWVPTGYNDLNEWVSAHCAQN